MRLSHLQLVSHQVFCTVLVTSIAFHGRPGVCPALAGLNTCSSDRLTNQHGVAAAFSPLDTLHAATHFTPDEVGVSATATQGWDAAGLTPSRRIPPLPYPPLDQQRWAAVLVAFTRCCPSTSSTYQTTWRNNRESSNLERDGNSKFYLVSELYSNHVVLHNTFSKQ